ncbi:MAG: hypothetical protein JWO50_47 [Candidatus Kaiserbacteria bacterium]|nr:hypothetical protein [Candidatus Kaiserbacteria bacterium]
MKKIIKAVTHSIPFAVCVLGLGMTLYVVQQQWIRQSFNDYQMEVATDVARSLKSGANPSFIIPNKSVIPTDILASRSAWIVVLDESGSMVDTTANMGGQPVHLPDGILGFAKAHGTDVVTWQPNATTRQAIVVIYEPTSKLYVVTGKSMIDIESHIAQMGVLVAIGMCITIAGVYVVNFLLVVSKKI